MTESVADDIRQEHFYVFRTLHSDESWGVLLASSSANKLPNISFGMRVYALNEKEAISRAKDIYERIHKYDTYKEDVKMFMLDILVSFDEINNDSISKAFKYAILATKKCHEYFRELEDNKCKDVE